MEIFDHRCLRCIAKIRWSDFISNEQVRVRCGLKEPLSSVLMQRRWKWIGDVLHMQNNRLPLQTFMAIPGPLWKRPKGGVRMTTKIYFHKAA